MIAVVDFNHTVYDSNRYLSEFNEALKISQEKFDRAKGTGNYNVNFHIKSIFKNTALQEHQIQSAFTEIEKRLPTFVYPDAIKFLESFKGRKILLTKGDEENQKLFIVKTGVDRFFDEIKIVPSLQGKADFIKELCQQSDEEIVFINDYPEESKLVTDQVSRPIKSYLVERPNGSFPKIEAQEGSEVVKSLDEIPLG